MTQTLFTPRAAFSRQPVLRPLGQRILEALRLTADARALEAMPRDRLEDLGIPATTDANRRSSGEPGPLPHASLW